MPLKVEDVDQREFSTTAQDVAQFGNNARALGIENFSLAGQVADQFKENRELIDRLETNESNRINQTARTEIARAQQKAQEQEANAIAAAKLARQQQESELRQRIQESLDVVDPVNFTRGRDALLEAQARGIIKGEAATALETQLALAYKDVIPNIQQEFEPFRNAKAKKLEEEHRAQAGLSGTDAQEVEAFKQAREGTVDVYDVLLNQGAPSALLDAVVERPQGASVIESINLTSGRAALPEIEGESPEQRQARERAAARSAGVPGLSIKFEGEAEPVFKPFETEGAALRKEQQKARIMSRSLSRSREGLAPVVNEESQAAENASPLARHEFSPDFLGRANIDPDIGDVSSQLQEQENQIIQEAVSEIAPIVGPDGKVENMREIGRVVSRIFIEKFGGNLPRLDFQKFVDGVLGKIFNQFGQGSSEAEPSGVQSSLPNPSPVGGGQPTIQDTNFVPEAQGVVSRAVLNSEDEKNGGARFIQARFPNTDQSVMTPELVQGVQGGLVPKEAANVALELKDLEDVPLQDIPSRLTKANEDLIHRVIRAESNGAATAKSRAGARGLMQLMPIAVKDVRQNMGDEEFRSVFGENPDLDDPATNIALGTLHLNKMLQRFGQFSVEVALSAYNGGEGHTSRAVKAVQKDGQPVTWENVREKLRGIKSPSAFSENSQYPDKVLRAGSQLSLKFNPKKKSTAEELAEAGVSSI